MKTELSVDNTECMLYSQDNSIQYNNSANMINKFLMMEVEDTFQIMKPYPHRDITKKQLGFLIWEKKKYSYFTNSESNEKVFQMS